MNCTPSDFTCKYHEVCITFPVETWTIEYNLIYILRTCVSCVITFTGLILYRHPQLQKHPYKIYALAIICEGIYFENLNSYQFLCRYDRASLLMRSIPQFTKIQSPETHYLILYILISVWLYAFYLFLALMMVFNFIIYLDLYLTIKNPFYPRG